MNFAFGLATHDPDTTETGTIGDRKVYARKYTMEERNAVADETAKAAEPINEARRAYAKRLREIDREIQRIAQGGYGEENVDAIQALRDEANDLPVPPDRVPVADEMKAFLKPLNKRIADGGKAITPKDLLATLTEDEYRALIRFYAPSLLANEGDEGKA